jgi:hypothetical protein
MHPQKAAEKAPQAENSALFLQLFGESQGLNP